MNKHDLLEVRELSWSPQGHTILDQVSFSIQEGQFVGLLGPNGAGKSSLMRCIYRVCPPDSGEIRLGGKNIWQQNAKDVARQVAVILQEHSDHMGLRVRDVVALGLIPHKRLFEWESRADIARVEQVLAELELSKLANAPFVNLSGGEKQRCMLARAMVQQPRLLIMDEPTNHLDVHYQIDLLHKVKALGLTVLASFHDLNLAAAFCDQLLVLDEGRIVAHGPASEVLSEDLLAQTFRACAVIDEHPLHGHSRITYAYHTSAPSDASTGKSEGSL